MVISRVLYPKRFLCQSGEFKNSRKNKPNTTKAKTKTTKYPYKNRSATAPPSLKAIPQAIKTRNIFAHTAKGTKDINTTHFLIQEVLWIKAKRAEKTMSNSSE